MSKIIDLIVGVSASVFLLTSICLIAFIIIDSRVQQQKNVDRIIDIFEHSIAETNSGK